jgi:hypothetical protein
MTDGMPKVDPGTPKKKDAGIGGTGISGGIIITIICIILLRGFRVAMKNNPDRERIRQQQVQQEQAMQALQEQIRNTPPEKMGKAMKMLMGIKDEDTRADSNGAKPATPGEQPGTVPPAATRGE